MYRVLPFCILLLVACRQKPPDRPQQLIPVQVPAGLEVKVTPDGLSAWIVEAKNTRDVSVRLLWDESTFVDADGRSYGRLLRGRTKVIDETKPQLATVIVPDSYILEWCVPEELTDVAPRITPEGNRDYDAAMSPMRKGVGRMVLVFETDGRREMWEAALSFDGSKPPAPRRRTPTVPAAATPEPPAALPAE